MSVYKALQIPTWHNGVLDISAYRITSDTEREYFGIGIKDSLNL